MLRGSTTVLPAGPEVKRFLGCGSSTVMTRITVDANAHCKLTNGTPVTLTGRLVVAGKGAGQEMTSFMSGDGFKCPYPFTQCYELTDQGFHSLVPGAIESRSRPLFT